MAALRRPGQKHIPAYERTVLAVLRQLIKLRSENPPGHNRNILAFVKTFLTTHTDARVVYQRVPNARGNVIAVFGKPDTLLNAHLDTVPAAGTWQHSPFAMTRTERRVYGLGATDVKERSRRCSPP